MSRIEEDKTPFSFRVSEDLKDAFKRSAQAQDRSMSQLLRDYMRSYVEEHSTDLQFSIEEDV
jgi:predicted transcriptional regulator